MKVLRYFSFLLVFVAGCSVFPGLRVLSGEATSDEALSAEVVELSDLVMADKTGDTDPSLMAAADRIENADPNVDIIEIRKNAEDDTFVVNMLFNPPSDVDTQTQEGLINLYSAIQQAMELTWQGTMRESEGTSALHVSFIAPQGVPTLDNGGLSFVGVVQLNALIDRSDAISYLSGPRGLADFLDLIANGTLDYQSPETTELYQGQPNHPLFMIN
ncbi:MAG: hypothetical protein K8L99_28375 [Anaerolineae bacterium]|nr:hypothetical protein [Anaerolineae bacterium]